MSSRYIIHSHSGENFFAALAQQPARERYAERLCFFTLAANRVANEA